MIPCLFYSYMQETGRKLKTYAFGSLGLRLVMSHRGDLSGQAQLKIVSL